MGIRSVNLKHHVTALALAIGAGVLPYGMASAEPAPEALLQELRDASEGEAGRIMREIETTWSRSGSAAMDLLLKRGRDAIAAEDYQTAIEHLTALTDHAPQFAEGFHARAEAYFRADLYGPALDDLELALALDPTHFNAIFGLGAMFQQFGDDRRAARLYRQVLEYHPYHETAQRALDTLKRDGIGREL